MQANPTALAAYGLSLEDLRTALSQANVDQAKGTLNGPRQTFTINANDQMLTAANYSPLIIAYRNGGPIRLSDVAQAVDGVENTQQAAWTNTTPAVVAQHPAPARHEYYRSGGPRQGTSAPPSGFAALFDSRGRT